MLMIPSIFLTMDMMTLLAVSKQYQDVVIQEMSFEPVKTGKLSIPLNVEMFPVLFQPWIYNIMTLATRDCECSCCSTLHIHHEYHESYLLINDIGRKISNSNNFVFKQE